MKKTIYFTIVVFVLSLIGIQSCKKDATIKPITSDATINGLKIANADSCAKINAQSKESSKHIEEQGTITYTYGTDWSGNVQVVIASDTSTKAEHPNVVVPLPEGYVLIGGGAQVWPNNTPPGALLVASTSGGPQGELDYSWYAESKDHGYVMNHQVIAYAIGLKLNGVTQYDLEGYIYPQAVFSTISHYPSVSCYPYDDPYEQGPYVLLGGGAYDQYNTTEGGGAPNGAGNMLVRSMPDQTYGEWDVTGKDQVWSDPCEISAWAVGILSTNGVITIPGFGQLDVKQVTPTSTPNKKGFVTDSCVIDAGYVIACPGGWADYSGQGRLLTGVVPTFTSVHVTSKDHINTDASMSTWAYAIEMRQHP